MKDYIRIKEELRENLSEPRYTHTLYTQKEAVMLAKRYNENIEKASIAALLHDCAKDMTTDEMLRVIENQRVRLDKIEKSNPSLLHSIAGSIIARYHFKVTDRDVLNAITYHTTGRENMSRLEKIVFIADAVEETRDYDYVEAIRKMAYQNIDEAIRMRLDQVINNILKSRELLHTNTIKARNYLIMQKEEKHIYIEKFEGEDILELEKLKREVPELENFKEKKVRRLEEFEGEI